MAVVVNEVTGNRLPGRHLGSRPPGNGWGEMQRLVLAQAPELHAPLPGMPGLCAVCRGPAGRGRGHCFQCDLQGQCAGGGLADLVVPIAYASKAARTQCACGNTNPFRAHRIGNWRVGCWRPCCWCSCVITGGAGGGRPGLAWPPTHLAVVPSARGRPGPHPLRALIGPHLSCRWTDLVAIPDYHHVRELDPDRFLAAPVPGGRILLLDDTWTTGASAQSAAMALRRAGARSVATVVLGPSHQPRVRVGQDELERDHRTLSS